MIDLADYMKFLKKRSKFIIISIIVIGILGFLYTKTIPLQYQSSVNIYTNDPQDLQGFLSSINSITDSFNKLPNQYKANYNKSTLFLFLRNIRVLQTGTNIVNLNISTNNSSLTKAWITSFKETISSKSLNTKMDKILTKDYHSCIKSQKNAIQAIKTSHLKINIPICSKVIFVKSISSPSLITQIAPSSMKDTIIIVIAGFFIIIAIASFIEYKQ